MKKSMFFALITGAMNGIILTSFDITVDKGLFWAITVPLLTILNLIYFICKDG